MNTNSPKKYWHELTDEEAQAVVESGLTWQDLVDNYKQPDWCEYPEALMGMAGCWSLTGRRVANKEFCQDCDYFTDNMNLESPNTEPRGDYGTVTNQSG